MRQTIITHIIQDIKNMNVHKKNPGVNKKVQNFIFEILKSHSDTLAKRAIYIIIELYKKQVWNDAKTVNVISSGCLNNHPKVVLYASNFLTETTTAEYYDNDSDDDLEDEDAHRTK